MRQVKKLAQRGLLDPEKEDPFSLFVASTDIRYCYYADTHKILGNTFGMCVLQVRRPDLCPLPLLSDCHIHPFSTLIISDIIVISIVATPLPPFFLPLPLPLVTAAR